MAGVVVALGVGALVATRSGDGGDTGAGGSRPSDFWISIEHGNNGKLVTDGDAVCSTSLGSLYCVDGATGDDRFSVPVDDLVTPPTLVDDMLLVGSGSSFSGALQAYSMDGEQLWEAGIDVQADNELPVVDGVAGVIDGLMDGELVGVDVATGDEVWRTFTAHEFEDDRLIPRGMFTDGERFYVGVDAYDVDLAFDETPSFVVAVDPATGQELWRSPAGESASPMLALGGVAPMGEGDGDGSTVAFVLHSAQGRGVMKVLDAATSELRWEVPLTSDYASVAHVDGTTVLADGGDMRGYDDAGQELWAVSAPVVGRSPDLVSPGDLVVDQGHLFVSGYDVYEVNPATGASEIIASDVSSEDVAVVDGRLVIAGISRLEAKPVGGGED